MIDFNKLRGQDVGAAKRPPTPPGGSYFGIITAYKFADSRFANKDTGKPDGVLQLSIKPTEYMDGDVPADIKLDTKLFSYETAIVDANGNTLPGLFYTKKLAESLGITTSGRDIFEIAPEMVSAQVQFDLTERHDKNDPEVIYNDVRKLRARA